MDILVPILTMGILGLLFSLGLVFAYKKFRVYVDPKIEKIAEILPQANCGACGFAGCQAFAEAVTKDKAMPSGCRAGGEEVSLQISAILGVKAEEVIRKKARVHCRGTHDAAKSKGTYLGLSTCAASHLLGGNKQCTYACLSYGDCARACPFYAIEMSQEGLPIILEAKCTACGICVDVCPRNILELHPLDQEIIVFCRSLDRGPAARKFCTNACIACGICSRACPEAIIIENNLAKIMDYKKIDPAAIPEIEKCPTGAIGRLRKENER